MFPLLINAGHCKHSELLVIQFLKKKQYYLNSLADITGGKGPGCMNLYPVSRNVEFIENLLHGFALQVEEESISFKFISRNTLR